MFTNRFLFLKTCKYPLARWKNLPDLLELIKEWKGVLTMKIIQIVIILLFLINPNLSFADKLLAPPTGPVQCNQVYENTAQPKIFDNVLSSMNRACHYSGGLHVMHQTVDTYVVMTCTGDNPTSKLFACLFLVSGQDIF